MWLSRLLSASSNNGQRPQSPPRLSTLSSRLTNQTDLAPHVGASLDVMRRDASIMRESGPTLFTSVRQGDGVQDVVDAVLGAWRASGAVGKGKAKTKA